jgi:hypothetical protein
MDLVNAASVNLKKSLQWKIDETLRLRADERRKKLKNSLYKFHNNVSQN